MPSLKKILAALIIIITLLVFLWYIINTAAVRETLLDVTAPNIFYLFLCFSILTMSNVIILIATLSYLHKKMPIGENVILTSYSSVVNFFGPLQSGPGFRALYLKRKYSLPIRRFIGANLIFYAFLAIINLGILFLAYLLSNSATLLGVFGSIAIIGLVVIASTKIRRVNNFYAELSQKGALHKRSFWFLGLSSFLLTFSGILTYFTELNMVNSATTLSQTIVYSAAANIALFVSLTPGALGIRESFLLVTQPLHNVSTTDIIAANVIDRAFYILFLFVVFLLSALLHFRQQLK
jgi:uncharacterized membrane protein YbhN (UPF0104 family)